jgi:hypothetical protein
MSTNRPHYIAWLPSILVAGPAILIIHTLYGGHWFESQEDAWYPIRVVEYLQNWNAGTLYARWCPDLYGGYGYPLFNWYPPGICAMAAGFAFILGIDATSALKLVLDILLIAGGVGVYGLVYGETCRSDAAVVGGIIYLFFPYRLTDLFTRGELTEFAGYSLIPFVLWGYRALGRAQSKDRPWIGVLTALMHAAVWFCHPVIGFVLTVIVSVLVLLEAVSQDDRRAFWRFVVFGECVAALATAIVFVYLIPALFEQSLVRIDNLRLSCQPTTKYLVNWRWLLGPGFFAIGKPTLVGAAVLMASLAGSLVIARLRRGMLGTVAWWLPAFLLLLFIVDTRFSRLFWTVLPLGKFILFPWRLNGFIGIFGATGIGVMWANLFPAEWLRLKWLLAIAVVLLVAIPARNSETPRYTSEPTSDQLKPASIRTVGLLTTVIADEYLPITVSRPPDSPRGSNEDNLVQGTTGSDVAGRGERRVGSHLFELGVVKAAPASPVARERNPLSYVVEVHASGPSVIDLRLFAYPGWITKTLTGPAEVTQTVSPDGLIRLNIPEAGDFQLTEDFRATPLRQVSALASLLALVLLYPVLWYSNARELRLRAQAVSSATASDDSSPALKKDGTSSDT